MPVNRDFTPSTQNDGIWYPHHSLGGVVHGEDFQSTTNRMLYSTFSEEAEHIPPPAPVGFQAKEATNYRWSHKFSQCDNKYAVAYGINFGEPKDRKLGKAIIPVIRRTNYTDRNFLKNLCLDSIEHRFDTVYGDAYQPKRTEFPPIHRRYPREYEHPAKGWVPVDPKPIKKRDIRPNIPWRPLSSTQRPDGKHNTWSYSYYPVHKIKYEMRRKPPIRDRITRYGPIVMNKTT
ncbi:uncharacterized protein LOC121384284 [Gigantopelta aegis]|uniref:uncharacterized protein LOC121384284 n=1 Tax=Gigantopelta aegis TaxID=1735272 RepID=UPI001B887E91|nr:uncharacterized protein LOC121384284 [Gigantopelta aegis]